MGTTTASTRSDDLAGDPRSEPAALSPSMLSLIEQRHHLLKALHIAAGYMTNAAIDLETGAPKRTAINTINGGLQQIREAIAAADMMASGTERGSPVGTPPQAAAGVVP